jgi:hypothetical protein
MTTMMIALRDWQTFYVLTGTAAATLIGLLFVAVSISGGITRSVTQIADSIRSFVTPILWTYAQVLLISCLAVMPLQGPLALTIVLVALGCLDIALTAQVGWRFVFLHREDMDRGHWVWHFVLPLLAGILFVVSALGLLWGQSLAPLGLAITDLLCLAIGLRNSWLLTVWIILNQRQGSAASADQQARKAELPSLTD